MIILQKAVIKKNGKYLMLLRPKDARYYPGLWDFVGGKLGINENPRKGLEREAKEEANLTIKAKGILWEGLLFTPWLIYWGRVYATELVKDKLKINQEHDAYKWVKKSDILKMKVPPLVRKGLSVKSHSF